MKNKNNLPILFYIFGGLGILNAITKGISSGVYTSGLINKVLFYPFSFLPFSSVSFFIISGILDLSIVWLVLGYFLQQKNKVLENNKPSMSYKISKWLLILLCSILILTVLWGATNFFRSI